MSESYRVNVLGIDFQLLSRAGALLKLTGTTSEPDHGEIIETALREMVAYLRQLPEHARGNRYRCQRCNAFDACEGRYRVADFLCQKCRESSRVKRVS